ncbi:uncharacterized protein si:ch1073-220m6.1 [Hippoglossus hippoglossus]|uniref:uncharacterized protein si:ch1073-220m6.1 n=1 Tax=Hippoglossus hippoglossus TaxID=8267 RepID=UPI00148DED58|nr:uncharacterized protein si:ch1073-220m6.1 [Hippoglossus hippoglossus]
MFLLLSCWILTGIRAEDTAVTHYKMKNSSICLNVTKPPPYLGGSWKFAGMLIASKEHMNPRFAKKVEFSPKNLTLCIKGLTHTDTGIYEATINDRNFTQSTEKHRVIVQDSVPRPAVQVSVLHSNQSAGLCSTAVNCSVRGEWALADCDEDGCRASQRSRPEVIRITISAVNWTVVCSANNHVSAETESANMATACKSFSSCCGTHSCLS